jgi:hypothetical protein
LRVKRMDIEFDNRLGKLYEAAIGKGLWKGTQAARSRADYWAAGVEAYFDAAGDSQAANRADRPITTRGAQGLRCRFVWTGRRDHGLQGTRRLALPATGVFVRRSLGVIRRTCCFHD